VVAADLFGLSEVLAMAEENDESEIMRYGTRLRDLLPIARKRAHRSDRPCVAACSASSSACSPAAARWEFRLISDVGRSGADGAGCEECFSVGID
jgi:hypothetical protein